MNNFNINLNCVVFSTNITLNQRFILSLDQNQIVLPSMSLNDSHLENIDESLIAFLKQYIFVNDLELMPQLINIHSNAIVSNDTKTLNTIYGFIVQHTNSLNNAFWVEFDLLKEQPYSLLLFEVIQKLR